MEEKKVEEGRPDCDADLDWHTTGQVFTCERPINHTGPHEAEVPIGDGTFFVVRWKKEKH